MEIRPATAKDQALWLEVRRSLWPHLSREAHERAIAGLLSASGTGRLLVLHEEEVRMGYVEGRILPGAKGPDGPGAIGLIESWYILPNFRRGDIGAHLLGALETWFQSQGCTELRGTALVGKEASYKHHVAVAAGEEASGSFFGKSPPPRVRDRAGGRLENAVEPAAETLSAEKPASINPRLEALARLAREQEPDAEQ